jgi:hypothetical protein
MSETSRPGGTLPGFALLGCFLCGIGGLALAAVSVGRGEFVGAGLGLLAGAAAFGQLVSAAWRR